jgi:WD40 repeat protein
MCRPSIASPTSNFARRKGPITSIAASNVGAPPLIATGGADGTARLWEARFGAVLRGALPGHRAAIHGLVFSRDLKSLYTVDDEGLTRKATTRASRVAFRAEVMRTIELASR